MVRYVGLDVHKHSIVGCVVDEKGKVLRRFTLNEVSASSLAHFIKTHLEAEDHVALEATTNASAVARAIEPHVARVVVSNPMATRLIAHAKVKTDKVDAHALAQLLRLDFLPSVWRADEATSQLRQWTARRSRLVSHITAITNRIHALLAGRLLSCPFDLSSEKGRTWLNHVPLDEGDRWLLDSDLRLLDAVEKERDAIDIELAKRSYPDPRLLLLMTLPGVSQHTAQSLLAAIGDVSRFKTAAALGAYLGLTPSTHQSGNHCYNGRITKAGRGHTRWMLVQAAHAAADHPGPVGHFFRRLRTRKNHNVAVVATAHKLALIAWHLLKTGQPYRYAIPSTTEAKLAKLRVAATGEKRRGGSPRGVKCVAAVPGQPTRAVRGLDEVYQVEGLPTLVPPPAGEGKFIQAVGIADFADEVRQSKRIPRQRKADDAPQTTSGARAAQEHERIQAESRKRVNAEFERKPAVSS